MRCPECGKVIKDPEPPCRPFCSERCKLLDLGKWISGGYRIASAEQDESENEITQTESPEET